MNFTIHSIATVENNRLVPEDDDWAQVSSRIILNPEISEETIIGIEQFSHLEIIFYFHLVKDQDINLTARHPRNNPNWAKAGIFAQRAKNRPNKLGHSIVKLIKKEGKVLWVEGLDAINGTPVIDIKPVMKEFLPYGEIKQPQWSKELMLEYWEKK